MPVKTLTSPRSEPQGTFRQATRGVSKEMNSKRIFGTCISTLFYSMPC